ncbi:hypothetical protein KL86APRO_12278 [uncultured Alphaproteobacteria bacterium]|uniref:Phage protein n=1 Tax=uncultured Alphaproteobacteria bacterium TaxID=91750 RepID=A0A212K7T5_9PROT|nr:hypothetical protein KL86APRO_12278 [uncultured Alphaproteobacteria bacterium]
MLQIHLSASVEGILAQLTEFEQRQVPFALAQALTKTAHAARKEVLHQMPQRFILRSGWPQKGLRVTPAHKNDANPTASVWTKEWYMADHESGGIRRPRSSGHLWIPTLAARAGGTIEGRVLSRNYPGNLRKTMDKPGRKRRKKPGKGSYAKPRPFRIGNSIYIRQDSERFPIVRLYSLAERAVYKPRWEFEKTIAAEARTLPRTFIECLDKALKTGRGGPTNSAYVDHLMQSGSDSFTSDSGSPIPSSPSFAQILTSNGED